MSYNYAPLAATAARLIAQFGQSIVFTKITRGAYDPAAGYATHTDNDYTVDIALFKQPKGELNETEIQAKRVKALMSSATAPEIGDTATINGENFRIARVDPLSPASTVIYYDLRLES